VRWARGTYSPLLRKGGAIERSSPSLPTTDRREPPPLSHCPHHVVLCRAAHDPTIPYQQICHGRWRWHPPRFVIIDSVVWCWCSPSTVTDGDWRPLIFEEEHDLAAAFRWLGGSAPPPHQAREPGPQCQLHRRLLPEHEHVHTHPSSGEHVRPKFPLTEGQIGRRAAGAGPSTSLGSPPSEGPDRSWQDRSMSGWAGAGSNRSRSGRLRRSW
jgi:hypothetical protein